MVAKFCESSIAPSKRHGSLLVGRKETDKTNQNPGSHVEALGSILKDANLYLIPASQLNTHLVEKQVTISPAWNWTSLSSTLNPHS